MFYLVNANYVSADWWMDGAEEILFLYQRMHDNAVIEDLMAWCCCIAGAGVVQIMMNPKW